MIFPANSTEVASLLRSSPPANASGLLVFPEPREHKIKMDDRVPLRWVQRGPSSRFVANVTRGEWFYFQLGLFATKTLTAVTLTPFELRFELLNGSSAVVHSQCLNTEGSTSLGEDVSPVQRPVRPGFDAFLVSVAAGSVQALWIGVNIPTAAAIGAVVRGTATLTSVDENGISKSQSVHTELTVSDAAVSADHGFGDLHKYARLAWLNSKLAIDDEVVAPYTPVQAATTSAGHLQLDLLNRRVTVRPTGLPSAVRVTRPASAHGVIAAREIELLAKPVSLEFIQQGGGALPLQVTKPAAITKAHTHTHTYIHIYTHKHMHIYTHVHTRT